MKKTLMVLVVVLFAAVEVCAEGRKEDSLASGRNKVTLTGTLQFVDGFPAISADGKTYKLFAPRLMREAYTLKPGLALTVEGYIVQPGPMMKQRAEGKQSPTGESVFVRKVTIAGKSFETGGFGPGGKGKFREYGQGGCGDGLKARGFRQRRGNVHGGCPGLMGSL